MKQPLRILSVIDIPWNSGLAAYAFDQALALRGAGHFVAFACPEGSAAGLFAAREGFRNFSIPDRKDFLRLPLALLRLRAAALEEKIDAVCAHTGRAQTLGLLLGLPLLRVKADVKKPAAGFSFFSVRKTIAASAYIEKLYLDAGLDSAGVTVIRQGIKLPPPSPRQTSDPVKIGLLGRLDPVKGHACFLKAAAELLRSGAKAEFHFAGYESHVKYADLLKIAEELDITASVVFHGRVEGPFKFMAACDVGVIASLGSEAVSRAALEWLASGRPLVSTSAGSLPEYVSPAWLVPPGDHLALAGKLAELLADPARIKILGEENRARAARDFSPDAFASATCAVFEAAVSSLSPSPDSRSSIPDP
ncbi:MAG: glycosyltransferase family 4 protein [Elusimicrobiota bacterium]|nr:glycosyltransferase family 4 protein [Elusimicrobiota bacterium]